MAIATPAVPVHAAISGYVIVSETGADSAGGSSRLPLSAINAVFQVGEFPTAAIAIPVGKPASSTASSATLTAREVADKLQHFKKIEVFIRIAGEFAPGMNWPSGPFRVFNGYVTGTSLTRTKGSLTMVVHATHWLIDMDASSALSSDVVAGTPIAIRLPAINTNWSTSAADPNDPTLQKISDNLWTEALKPKFVELCDGGTLMTTLRCGPDVLTGSPQLTNDTAKALIDDSRTAAGFDLASLVDIPSLTFTEQLKVALRGEVSLAATSLLYNGSLGQSSLWDKLREFAGMFQFVVIPTVDSAVCAPLMPCLAGSNSPRHLTIKANEYHTASPSQAVYRLWRGVSIRSHHVQKFNMHDASVASELLTSPTQLINAYLPDCGCYMAEQDADLPADYKSRVAHGSMRFIQAPPWAVSRSMVGALGHKNSLPQSNPRAGQKMQNVTQDEDFVGPPHAPGGESTTPDGLDPSDQQSLGDLYAKWYYWNQHFKHRTGSLVGKLRFDISPGSIVRIEDLDGKLYSNPAEFSYLYAHVVAVGFSINAVNAQASTKLTFTHIRRESEKEYGVDKHPFYADRWVGTVLQNVSISSGGRGSGATSETFVPVPGGGSNAHEVP